MSSNPKVEIVCNEEQTRAALKTANGEFILSRMVVHELILAGKPEPFTLNGVGKTRDGQAALAWVHYGVLPE